MAKEALKASGSKIRENEIIVEAAVPRQPKSQSDKPRANTKPAAADKPRQTQMRVRKERVPVETSDGIVIPDVPSDTCIRTIIGMFDGPIRSATISRGKTHKESSAIIRFHEDSDAKKALDKKSVRINGKDFEIKHQVVMRIKNDRD